MTMPHSLRARFQLELLKKLRQRRSLAQKGFTLVELMIVVAVVGLLAAIALPQFLAARARASAGARVGEVMGFAKECASDMASQMTNVVTPSPTVSITCGGAAQQVVTGTFITGAAGVRCLTDTAVAGDGTVTVTVSTNGSISCAFS